MLHKPAIGEKPVHRSPPRSIALGILATDDHLGLMDHLRVDKFMVLGFCIGGPMIWNLLKRAPDRIVAAVLAQPSGSRPEMRDLFYDNNMKDGLPELLLKRRPDITMEQAEEFLTRIAIAPSPDFVFTMAARFRPQLPDPRVC